jgi:hypothetical protein
MAPKFGAYSTNPSGLRQTNCVMEDSFESQDSVRIGVAAALARQFTADARGFLPLLCKVLRQWLPNETREITTGLFKKSTVGVEVSLDEFRYKILDPGNGRPVAERVKVVRGIALKTEEISMERCLEEISEAIELRAQKSTEDRAAMARMLGLG